MTKSLMWLLEGILLDSSIRCGTDTHRDFVTVSRRIKHEGVSFLTITLPRFAKDFERSLEQGAVDPTCFVGFSRHGALPRFLGGLLGLVFDRVDGSLINEPSIDAILCVRQICLMFKKVNLQCSLTRTKEAFDGYVNCENELGQATVSRVYQPSFERRYDELRENRGSKELEVWNSIHPRGLRAHAESFLRDGGSSCEVLYHLFGRISDVLWSSVLVRCNGDVAAHRTRPKHGPGATAELVHGNAKYELRKWHTRLEKYFPLSDYGVPNPESLLDGYLSNVEFVEPGAEQPVRVISVPKTLSTPRIIAIEPVCMQYTQQALARSLTECLETHPLTAGQINFTDQLINRELAYDSSISRKYGTIDLSEASDRVHSELVWRMLQSVPALRQAVFDCRSTSAALPDGRIVHLEKFASMGSALCFPIESMVFFTLCLLEGWIRSNEPLTLAGISNLCRRFHVYGDDLIVPSDEVPAITRTLELFGLKVNTSKTFYRGSFRESCGMDAYDGVDVTPVYVRRMPPCDRSDALGISSYVPLANHLYKRGWWATAKRVREFVEGLTGPLPHVREESQALGWCSFLGSYTVQRWNKDLHLFEVKGPVLVPTSFSDPLTGYGALLKFFLKEGREPLDRKSLTHSIRRGSVNIKYRWVRAA